MNDEAFYELSLKYFENTASAQEKEILQEYLLKEDYKQKYEVLQDTFQNNLVRGNEFNVKRGLKKLRHKIAHSERRHKINYKKGIAIAATIVTLLGVGFYISSVFTTPQTINYVTVTSPLGKRINVVLPDSSTVYLNSGASVNYPEQFTVQQRLVQLTGEAFFNVKRNVNKPFVVQSGAFTTTVLGTSFNVDNTDENHFQVAVKTGKVKVENNTTKKQVILEKNTQAVYNQLKGHLVKTPVDAKAVTDWHKNILRFNAITAKEAFNKIEQWYNVKVLCESQTILNRKLYASYNNEPIDKVLKSLQFMIGIQYTIEDNTVLIK